MKPLVIAAAMRDGTGTGIHTHVHQLAVFAGSTGAAVTVLWPLSRHRPRWSAAFAVRPLLLQHINNAASVWWYRRFHELALRDALRHRLRRGDDVVVYAQDPLAARAALAARRRPAQRVVMAVHFNTSQADEWAGLGLIPWHGRLYRAIRRLEADVVPRLDAIVYVSEHARRVVEGQIPAAVDVPGLVMPNFVAEHQSGPGDVGDGVAQGNDLISIGTLQPRKNHGYLLHVLAGALQLGERVTLTVVGDGPEQGKLQALAHTLGVADQVNFVGHHPNARALLPRHRVYAHASLQESFGLVLVEAMAASLPVIAAPVGGIPEVVSPREGVFWALDDPAEGARLLVALLRDNARLDALGRAARARYERDYGPDRARQLLTVLQEA